MSRYQITIQNTHASSSVAWVVAHCMFLWSKICLTIIRSTVVSMSARPIPYHHVMPVPHLSSVRLTLVIQKKHCIVSMKREQPNHHLLFLLVDEHSSSAPQNIIFPPIISLRDCNQDSVQDTSSWHSSTSSHSADMP